MAGEVKLLKEKIKTYSVYSPFIKFTIGKEGDNQIVFESGGGRKYFMAMRNQKSGTGQANTFTVDIAFAPEPYGTSVTEVNYYDLALTLESKYCTLQYGYQFPDGEVIQTPKYIGEILNYKIQIQNGLLLYNITGYSGISTIKDAKNTLKTSFTLLGQAVSPQYDPFKMCEKLIGDALKESKSTVKYTFDYSAFEKGSAGEGLYPVPLNQLGYTGEELHSWTNKWLNENGGKSTDVPVMDIVTDILRLARCEKQKDMASPTVSKEESTQSEESSKKTAGLYEDRNEKIDTETLITYSFLVRDVEEKGNCKIKFIYNDPNAEPEEQEIADEFVFDWMSGEFDDLVMDFQPEFDGAVARAIAEGVEKDATDVQAYMNRVNDQIAGLGLLSSYAYTDSTGKIVLPLSTIWAEQIKPTTGGSYEKDLYANASIVATYESLIYKASMRTLGLPEEIDILTQIQVTPLIYGKPHQTAGVYQITGITDDVSTNGFTTSLELCRVGSAKQFKEHLMNLASGGNVEAYEQEMNNTLGILDIEGDIKGTAEFERYLEAQEAEKEKEEKEKQTEQQKEEEQKKKDDEIKKGAENGEAPPSPDPATRAKQESAYATAHPIMNALGGNPYKAQS